MSHGDCKSYSLVKYVGPRSLESLLTKLGSSSCTVAGTVRIIWSPRCVKAANGSFSIDLTNVLLRDWEKRDYEPLAVLDYLGARRYLSAFWFG
jgi:hypothetical protein